MDDWVVGYRNGDPSRFHLRHQRGVELMGPQFVGDRGLAFWTMFKDLVQSPDYFAFYHLCYRGPNDWHGIVTATFPTAEVHALSDYVFIHRNDMVLVKLRAGA